MKKYLILGMAAMMFCGAFTSCSRETDFGSQTQQQKIQETYEEAFKTRFGTPATYQDWGFGSSRAKTREENANANEWADPDKEYGGWLVPDPLTSEQKLRVQKYFQYNQYPGGTTCDYTNFFVQQVYKGGKDPLTKYDDTMINDTLKYSEEKYKSANDGWVVGSNHMDHLTAGSIHDHINNFNYGDYNGGGTVNVLDSAQHVGGSTHPDQIMLMVDSKTDCFGYWNSDGSLGHDNRYRLVSAATIDTWAETYGGGVGARVQDHWNRGFIGFDFDQVVGEDIYNKINVVYGEGGKIVSYDIDYAKYRLSPAGDSKFMAVETDITDRFNLDNPWGKNNGETASLNNDNIIVYNGKQWGGIVTGIGGSWADYGMMVVEFAEPTSIKTQILIQREGGEYRSEAEAGSTKLIFDFNGKDMTGIKNVAIQPAADGTIYIKKIYLLKPESFNTDQYIMNGEDKVPLLSSDKNQYCGERVYLAETDVKTVLKNHQCVIKSKIDEMVADGWLPVNSSNLREWVKVGGGADGYYSDWIVTIAEAKHPGNNEEPETNTVIEKLRVIAEDLSVGENTDFDFNDVVFDVIWTKVYADQERTSLTSEKVEVELLAAGGTLPLYVDGKEVHDEFDKANENLSITVSTMVNTHATSLGGVDNAKTVKWETTKNANDNTIGDIANRIEVKVTKNGTDYTLSAPVGAIASKIGVKTNFVWCDEREDIDHRYGLVDGTSLFTNWVQGIYPAAATTTTRSWYEYAKDEIEEYKAAIAAAKAAQGNQQP